MLFAFFVLIYLYTNRKKISPQTLLSIQMRSSINIKLFYPSILLLSALFFITNFFLPTSLGLELESMGLIVRSRTLLPVRELESLWLYALTRFILSLLMHILMLYSLTLAVELPMIIRRQKQQVNL
ncbi:MAG: hypothetical protein ACRCTJ_05645 [Brevinema sp.]